MTKAIPNDAKLILFTDDTEGWSNETTSVRVPTCCPTVQAMRLDEERDTLERQRTPVDAAHSVASQDVTPTLARTVCETRPNPEPETVMLTDPVDG